MNSISHVLERGSKWQVMAYLRHNAILPFVRSRRKLPLPRTCPDVS